MTRKETIEIIYNIHITPRSRCCLRTQISLPHTKVHTESWLFGKNSTRGFLGSEQSQAFHCEQFVPEILEDLRRKSWNIFQQKVLDSFSLSLSVLSLTSINW